MSSSVYGIIHTQRRPFYTDISVFLYKIKKYTSAGFFAKGKIMY